MKASLQNIDIDVWVSVEDGYEVSKIVDKDGVVINKPLAKCTKSEKEMSRYFTKALSCIFTSVKKNISSDSRMQKKRGIFSNYKEPRRLRVQR